jgi:hypothetical protein
MQKRTGSGSGSVSKLYGSSDPDPYQYKNVTDLKYCCKNEPALSDIKTSGKGPYTPLQTSTNKKKVSTTLI